MHRSLDTHAEAEQVQLAIFRNMGAQRRLQTALTMADEARSLTADGIRSRHPDYSEAEVLDALRLVMLGEELYRQVWPARPLPEP